MQYFLSDDDDSKMLKDCAVTRRKKNRFKDYWTLKSFNILKIIE